MQSLNEELTTVNTQLQAKMEEHQSTRNDLASLLTQHRHRGAFPRHATSASAGSRPPCKELLELISSDVGRPLSDLAKKFTDPDLQGDGEAVLDDAWCRSSGKSPARTAAGSCAG